MDKELMLEYIAIRVTGLDYFIWFETAKTKIDTLTFVGKSGWGKGRKYTNIECKVSDIEALIHSKEIQ